MSKETKVSLVLTTWDIEWLIWQDDQVESDELVNFMNRSLAISGRIREVAISFAGLINSKNVKRPRDIQKVIHCLRDLLDNLELDYKISHNRVNLQGNFLEVESPIWKSNKLKQIALKVHEIIESEIRTFEDILKNIIWEVVSEESFCDWDASWKMHFDSEGNVLTMVLNWSFTESWIESSEFANRFLDNISEWTVLTFDIWDVVMIDTAVIDLLIIISDKCREFNIKGDVISPRNEEALRVFNENVLPQV